MRMYTAMFLALRRHSPSSDPSFRWAPFPEFQWRSFDGGHYLPSHFTEEDRDSGWKLVQGYRAPKGNSETGSERVSDQTEVTQLKFTACVACKTTN